MNGCLAKEPESISRESLRTYWVAVTFDVFGTNKGVTSRNHRSDLGNHPSTDGS